MSDDWEKYERECERIRKENAVYLDEFRKSLEADGLAPKTVARHVENVDFYINDFLLYEMPEPAKDGALIIGWFLGDFFIRKCTWSTPTSIMQNAASLKKFYKYLLSEGVIDADNYSELLDTIKSEMDEWLDECETFNNPGSSWGW